MILSIVLLLTHVSFSMFSYLNISLICLILSIHMAALYYKWRFYFIVSTVKRTFVRIYPPLVPLLHY